MRREAALRRVPWPAVALLCLALPAATRAQEAGPVSVDSAAVLRAAAQRPPGEPTTLLVLRRAEFLAILEERPQVAERMLAHLARRLRELETSEYELRHDLGAGEDAPAGEHEHGR